MGVANPGLGLDGQAGVQHGAQPAPHRADRVDAPSGSGASPRHPVPAARQRSHGRPRMALAGTGKPIRPSRMWRRISTAGSRCRMLPPCAGSAQPSFAAPSARSRAQASASICCATGWSRPAKAWCIQAHWPRKSPTPSASTIFRISRGRSNASSASARVSIGRAQDCPNE